jgi:Nucleotidyltransferase domain
MRGGLPTAALNSMSTLREQKRWRALNPPATAAELQRARSFARTLVPWLRGRGATCVVLGGSWARGDAHRESDIDLWVFGLGSGTDVLWRAPFMVVIARTSERSQRRRLGTPPYLGGSVPGWRVARPLYDPHGIARRLKAEAVSFSWDTVRPKCTKWIGEQISGWAEEAIKLVRAMGTGNGATAAVQRNLLADYLGFVMAIHRRMFWDSENEFWERIGRQVGGEWARVQRRALGIPRASLGESCDAALSLYALTAGAVWRELNLEQREIAAHACRVAGRPLDDRPISS